MSVPQIIMALGGVGFLYALVKKPEWLAIVLFTAIIAEINFDVPGMPMNFRAICSLCLLARVMGMPANDRYPRFFSTGYAWHIMFFVLYMMAITAKNNLLEMGQVKEFILSFVAAYLGYFFYMRQNGYQLFKWAIIFAGLVCFGDLAYTYAFVGGFPVQRFYYLFVPAYEVFNHNFFGYICGASFIFLLNDYLCSTKNVKINLWLMPVMFLGVLLSTSRSSLLIMMILAMILVARELMSSKKKGKKAYTLISITFVCLLITLFIFQIIQEFIASDSEFLKQITGRLIDEPVAILNRALGNDYNANNLDSMDWRAEASALAYYRFVNLIPEEQLFGIGYNGFLARDYGFAYDAHNGILLVMIEFGIFGFLVYYSLLIMMIIKSVRMKLNSPFTLVLIYMILYVASHNKELTAFFCFLVHGSLAAHMQVRLHEGEEEVEVAEIEPNPA